MRDGCENIPDSYGCCERAGYCAFAVSAILDFLGQKKNARNHPLSRPRASVCDYGDAGCVLPEKYFLYRQSFSVFRKLQHPPPSYFCMFLRETRFCPSAAERLSIWYLCRWCFEKRVYCSFLMLQ